LPALQTKPGTRRLSEVARHVVQPDGIVSTGWPRVRDTCNRFGIGFDAWQDGAGRLILSKDKDGLYAARDGVVMSIPRQVGKTYLIGWIIFALCLCFPGLTVIWTAHRVKTAKETFNSMAGMARRKSVLPHVLRVMRGRGDESIEFRNGSRILFGARESGFGRGFAGVDIIVFDEAQILTEGPLEDMLAAQNTSANALTFYIGTPPRPKDPGEAFTRFRDEALTGVADGTLYIELSADKTLDEKGPVDREQLAKANPSFPHRTTERAILRLVKRLAPESVRHEVYGIWDESAHKPVVTRPFWDRQQAMGLLPDVPAQALAIDRDPGGELIVAGCWLDEDEAHVELLPIPQDEVAAVAVIAARCGRRIPVLMSGSSPAKSLVPGLKTQHVKVLTVAGPDMATACGLLLGDLAGERLTHAGQKALTDGLMAARTKPYGDAGAKVWEFGTPGMAAVIAVTLARFGAALHHRKKSTSSGSRRAVVM
jgi:hypothetical protein